MGRKSNVCAHNNWGVPIKVLTSVNNAPWCVVRKSVFYPPIELHGHCSSAWRVIKCVPLVTDFMGRVYVKAPKLKIVRNGNVEVDAKAREADDRRKCLGVVDAFAVASPFCNKASLVP
jgi:hypothetical protein